MCATKLKSNKRVWVESHGNATDNQISVLDAMVDNLKRGFNLLKTHAAVANLGSSFLDGIETSMDTLKMNLTILKMTEGKTGALDGDGIRAHNEATMVAIERIGDCIETLVAIIPGGVVPES